jgi:RHS repeat-associated protein
MTSETLSRSTGKERDQETGLDYFGARYYGSALGRFTSPDWSGSPEPVPYANLGDPQTLNLYAYVRDNPLSRSDPDGHCCWDYVVGFAKGTANRFLDTAASDVKNGDPVHQFLGRTVYHTDFRFAATGADQQAGMQAGYEHGAEAVAVATIVGGPKGETVEASSTGDAALAARATEIHSALDPIAQNMRTTAAASVTDANGVQSTLVGSSSNTLSPAQRAALQPGETAVTGPGHAEVTVVNAAQAQGMTVNAVAASRPICSNCQQVITNAGARPVNPQQ